MVYEEFPEWKQLKKEKKYKEAVEKLMYEISVNMMRVSNLYCDDKYDPYEKYYIACGPCYGENIDGKKEKKLYGFIDISCELSCYRLYLDDLNEEDDIPYHCKYVISRLIKWKKHLLKLMKEV